MGNTINKRIPIIPKPQEKIKSLKMLEKKAKFQTLTKKVDKFLKNFT
tara:strand:+ start:481 stop:621 length:141 start_codon:yes stop_codon:yes gene_type:complete